MHLKFVAGSDCEIEGLGAPYGGPFNGADIEGERFSPRTDFCEDWFDSRPILFNHGLDGETKTAVVGRVTAWSREQAGLWVKAQLDKSSKYFSAIKELIDQDSAYFSSGAMSHLVQKSAKSGEILRWPWVELSITPTPANPFATLDFATAEKHFKSAGLDVEGLKATLDAAARDALPDSDFAYVDADGNRHLPINDESHVRAALSRFNQTQFASDQDKAAARRKILAAAKKFGIDVSDDDNASGKSGAWEDLAGLASDAWPAIKLYADGTFSQRSAASCDEAEATKSVPYGSFPEGSYEDLIQDLAALLNPVGPYAPACYSCIVATFPDHVITERHEMDDGDDDCTFWKVAYTVGDDGEPVLGTATQVEQTYVPAKAHLYEGPLTLDAQALSRHARALEARTKGVHERRVAEGRVLSAGNLARITDAAAGIKAAHEGLVTLLDASERIGREQAQAKALLEPDAVQRRLAALTLFVDSATA